MKTTSTTVIEKKINVLVSSKKISKSSLVYKWVLNLKTGDVLRPVFSTGSTWRHSALTDKSFELESLLKSLGIDFESGNDAPRGGKTGYYVRILTKIKNNG